MELSFLDHHLITISGTEVTPLTLVGFVVTLVVAVTLGRLVRTALLRLLTRHGATAPGLGYAVARIGQYTVVVVGILLGLENIGISLTTLAAAGAVLMVGIGFGLQNIAQNFVSGLILLIERPVQKGDVVIVGQTYGIVEEISIRATRVMTFDNIAIIVPNSQLISGVVENRSQPTRVFRVRIDVGVAYGSDTRAVEEVLLGVARDHEQILSEPQPVVFFTHFGDSSLDFQLCVWLDEPESALQVGSDLRHRITEAFAEAGVTIPFPQRDVHLYGTEPAVAGSQV